MSEAVNLERLRYQARELWARGKNTAEIAKALSVSEDFVFNQKLYRRVTIAAQPEGCK